MRPGVSANAGALFAFCSGFGCESFETGQKRLITMGRPSKFTEAARKKILQALTEGCTRGAAAGVAGVHKSQMTRWCESNKTFATECAIAEQQAEARFTNIIYKGALYGETKYALEWLKRRRREEWGDNVTAEISGPGGGPIPIREIVIERQAAPEQEAE